MNEMKFGVFHALKWQKSGNNTMEIFKIFYSRILHFENAPIGKISKKLFDFPKLYYTF